MNQPSTGAPPIRPRVGVDQCGSLTLVAVSGSQVSGWSALQEWTPNRYRAFALVAGALGFAFLGLAIVWLVSAVHPRWEPLPLALIGSVWFLTAYIAWRKSAAPSQRPNPNGA